MRVTVQIDSSGNYFVELPEELLNSIGWKVGDTVEWEDTWYCTDDGECDAFTLRKVNSEQ